MFTDLFLRGTKKNVDPNSRREVVVKRTIVVSGPENIVFTAEDIIKWNYDALELSSMMRGGMVDDREWLERYWVL